VCFDLLASQGIDRRGLPLAERRALLEDLLVEMPAPITLCPHTTSGTEAMRWLDTLPDAGIEGVMIKDRTGVYPQRAGQRVWRVDCTNGVADDGSAASGSRVTTWTMSSGTFAVAA
jgi:ATP-dependent DNA ligase